MEEIVKHINDTNASYRSIGSGDAKNTDIFLDNEHYELFCNSGDEITVRFSKENLTKAILFIASILPRKYDNSSTHETISYSNSFVYDQLLLIDAFFKEDGVPVELRTQKWTLRKDVQKKNGKVDKRFYFNGLIETVEYNNSKGEHVKANFIIRNYLAGGFSDLHIKKADNDIFDVWITNNTKSYDDGKERGFEIPDTDSFSSRQYIFYGAPGTGKSNTIKCRTIEAEKDNRVFRTTFHPDSDYSTFVGCYKPTMIPTGVIMGGVEEERISYKFVPQTFINAYVKAWSTYKDVYLIIEEINRGNCAQIFGDLFQLLDRKEGVSEYSIDADKDLARYLQIELDKSPRTDFLNGVKEGKKLALPYNLYIWATMNTSDQSLFPIDSAFKRRWEWKYIPIKNQPDKNYTIEISKAKYDWWGFLVRINDVINSTTNSEDKKLGYFFAKAEDGKIKADQFVGKVLFYLWNDVFKNYGFDNPIFEKVDKGKYAFSDFFLADGKPNTKSINSFMTQLDEKIKKEEPMIIEKDEDIENKNELAEE